MQNFVYYPQKDRKINLYFIFQDEMSGKRQELSLVILVTSV